MNRPHLIWTMAALLALAACQKEDEPKNDDNSGNTEQTTPGNEDDNTPGEDDEAGIPDDMTAAFPDANFRTYVLEHFDRDGDGRISPAEAETVRVIDIDKYSSTPDSEKIASLEGIQYFTNLTELWCSANLLTKLDVSRNTRLTELWCSRNQLTDLDVSGCTMLTQLSCANNRLTKLHVGGCAALASLYCNDNRLTALEVSRNSALAILYCGENQLTALDVSRCTKLVSLACESNPLATLTLKTGQSIYGITEERTTDCIPADTEILFVD